MESSILDQGEATRLACLREYKVLDTPPDASYDRLTSLAARLLGAPVAVLVLVDARRLWFKSCYGIDSRHIARDTEQDSTTEPDADARGDAQNGSDAASGLQARVRNRLKDSFGMQFAASAALLTPEGMMLGSLCVLAPVPREIVDADDTILAELASIAMELMAIRRDASRAVHARLALQEKELKSDAQKKISDSEKRRLFALKAARIGDWQLDLVTGVAQHSALHDQCFGYSTPLDHWTYSDFLAHVHLDDRAMVDRTFTAAQRLSGLYEVEFRVVWPDGSLHWLLSRGCFYHDHAGRPVRAAGIQVDITQTKMAQQHIERLATVIRNVNTPVMTTDSRGRIEWINQAFLDMTGFSTEEVIGRTPGSLLQGPESSDSTIKIMREAIRAGRGFEVDILNYRKDGTPFWQHIKANPLPAEAGEAPCYLAVQSDISERKKLESQLWEKANYDGLTSLPNRRLFWDRLVQEVRHAHRMKKSVALIFIDLDRFKEINDLYGHEAGDIVLCEVARRISGCVRGADTAARIGGDEFAAILSDFSATLQIDAVIRKLLRVLAEPIDCVMTVCNLSASIGIAVYPDDASNAEQLLKYADQAMYLAKSNGRDCFSYFTPAMQERAERRLRIGRDLRLALQKQQLDLHFQPIVDLATGRIVKAEALLRWNHPSRGAIGPSEFIPLAEELGLIESIGEWVFHEAALCAAEWSQQGQTPIQVSVNKSAMQFIRRSSAESWPQHLERLQIPGSRVSVEITEGVLLKDSQVVMDTLAEYRAAGMEVALDDFGTGYSAMGYLNKFSIDYLKIDQSFIRDIASVSSRTIAEAIIVMGQKLGMKIIAEGVETPEQREILLSAGCDFGQGFLFSRAVPRHEFADLLRRGAGC